MKFAFMLFLLMPLTASAQVPISEARKMKSGKTVTVAGHVTATFGDLAFIQDGGGAIAIYGVRVNIDDSISITGKLSKFNSLMEIVADSVRNFGQKPPIVPRLVDRIADHEAELVHIENVNIEPQGIFFYPQRAGILIHDNDTIHYWIDENTDIPGYPIPGTSSITGVVSRYGNQFQILPRSHIDVDGLHQTGPSANSYFKVMNWNLEFFGAPKYGPSNDSLQVSNVAAIINYTQPDIVALQEVSNDEAFRGLLKLTPGFEGRCSNRYSYSFDPSGDFPPQKLCFVYRSATVSVVREKILFQKLFDNDPSEMFSSGRLPYLLEVDALQHRLSLINIHAKSGADESDLVRRASDARILKDSIDQYYNDKQFILLGDLNDDLDQSIVADHESPYSMFLDDYNCVSKSLSEAGWHSTISYDDMIDHQIISSPMTDFHVSTRIVNVFGIVPLYGKTTSDHLPVMSEFDLTKLITAVDDDQIPIVFPNPTCDELWFPAGSDITVINSFGEIIIKKQGACPPILLGEYAPGLYCVVLKDQLVRIIRN